MAEPISIAFDDANGDGCVNKELVKCLRSI
jgi:hypothetical protein